MLALFQYFKSVAGDSTCPKFNLLDPQGLLSKEVLSCASFTQTICWLESQGTYLK